MAPGSSQPRKRARLAAEKGGPGSAAETLSLARAAESTADGLGAPAVALALTEILNAARPSRQDRDALAAAMQLLREAVLGDEGLGKGEPKDARGNSVACAAFLRGDESTSFVANPESIQFRLAPPEDMSVVGGYMLGLGKNPATADVAIQMPRQMFLAGDYLNHRYHDKRLLYLVEVASFLRDSHGDKFTSTLVTASTSTTTVGKPVLSLTPTASPNVTIRVLPMISGDIFNATKLVPSRGNLRPVGTSSVEAPASPSYNASILIDTLLVQHTTTLHRIAKPCPAFCDAALMLRLWAHRRRLADSGFVVAALLAHTIASGSAPARASKEHLFRAALGCVRRGVMSTLAVDGLKISTGWDNSVHARWRMEASAGLTVLDGHGAASDAWGGAIPFLFCTARGNRTRPVPIVCLFDAFVTVKISSGQDVSGKEFGFRPSFSMDDVREVLSQALVVHTERVLSVEGLGGAVFGLIFHPHNIQTDPYRKVDLRPEAVDVDAFKHFWGPKAELRRFQNGKIVEAVVWNGGPEVLGEITHYAVSRHFEGKVSTDVALGQFEEGAVALGIREETTRSIAVFNELSSLLRKVKGLPLSIKTILAVSPMLRRCAVQSVRPNKNCKFVEPFDILTVFENSAAWPEDVLAMASAKAAFYVALKSGLAELGIASRPTISFLDILIDGFVFRLRVRVDKEASIAGIEKEVRDRLLWETESRVVLHHALRNVSSPIFGDVARVVKRWLSSHLLLCEFGSRGEELVELIVARLFVVRNGREPRSIFSGLCQFLHLLSEFPWEAAPLVVPLGSEGENSSDDGDGNSHAGSGNTEYVFEDASDAYHTRQNEISSQDSGVGTPAIVLCSNHDPNGSWFAGKCHGPERVILKRASTAASAALRFIESKIFHTRGSQTQHEDLDSRSDKWSALFRTPSSSYQNVIALNRGWVPRSASSSGVGPFSSSRAIQQLRLENIIVGLDPVERLAGLLKEAHGEHVIFLYDKYGGSRIFMVWRPSSNTRTKFSLKSLPFMSPCPLDGDLLPDKDAVLANVKRLGGVMIKQIL